ncbi:hypothetical protein Hypma_003898 [Hypsizygus marmoreus]|uniref:Uncharacterized protein n=1 Tax=Hypsizygus marmoreus TaxID=39966 RepID=A0A369K414_HYPMA|nr:hypothetical protein Hypma_003898 [Hypsizygus marmoreus]
MFKKLAAVILVVVTVASAVPFGPAPALIPSLTPFFDIGAGPNITENGLSAVTPPTILFCSVANCVNCFRLSIVDRQFQTCLVAQPNPYTSVGISNPDGRYLDYSVWVSFTGSTCPGNLVQIPKTNVCYNLTPTGKGWFLRNTGTRLELRRGGRR